MSYQRAGHFKFCRTKRALVRTRISRFVVYDTRVLRQLHKGPELFVADLTCSPLLWIRIRCVTRGDGFYCDFYWFSKRRF
jgi:hypothetical protein